MINNPKVLAISYFIVAAILVGLTAVQYFQLEELENYTVFSAGPKMGGGQASLCLEDGECITLVDILRELFLLNSIPQIAIAVFFGILGAISYRKSLKEKI